MIDKNGVFSDVAAFRHVNIVALHCCFETLNLSSYGLGIFCFFVVVDIFRDTHLKEGSGTMQ